MKLVGIVEEATQFRNVGLCHDRAWALVATTNERTKQFPRWKLNRVCNPHERLKRRSQRFSNLTLNRRATRLDVTSNHLIAFIMLSYAIIANVPFGNLRPICSTGEPVSGTVVRTGVFPQGT